MMLCGLNIGLLLRLHLSLFVVSLAFRLLHLCLRLQVHILRSLNSRFCSTMYR